MIRITSLALVVMGCGVCLAQETTVRDAKRALSNAKEELEKSVYFRKQDEGGGAFLISEHKRIEHQVALEKKAEEKGLAKTEAVKFDYGKRLEKYEEQIEPEAFQMLIAYVGFVKACRKYEPQIKADEEFAEVVGTMRKDLDALIERHGRRLLIASLKLLYQDDPVSQVGAFNLRGKSETVRIDGREYELLKRQSVKERAILLNREGAVIRKGFLIAEIVGRETYRTEDGKSIDAFMLQAY